MPSRFCTAGETHFPASENSAGAFGRRVCFDPIVLICDIHQQACEFMYKTSTLPFRLSFSAKLSPTDPLQYHICTRHQSHIRQLQDG